MIFCQPSVENCLYHQKHNKLHNSVSCAECLPRSSDMSSVKMKQTHFIIIFSINYIYQKNSRIKRSCTAVKFRVCKTGLLDYILIALQRAVSEQFIVSNQDKIAQHWKDQRIRLGYIYKTIHNILKEYFL